MDALQLAPTAPLRVWSRRRAADPRAPFGVLPNHARNALGRGAQRLSDINEHVQITLEGALASGDAAEHTWVSEQVICEHVSNLVRCCKTLRATGPSAHL